MLVGVPLVPGQFTMRLFTDASLKGWGAHCKAVLCQGEWTPQEQLLHINILERIAVRLALLQLQLSSGQQVLVATDNTTVVAYINRQGGKCSISLWNALPFQCSHSAPDLSLHATSLGWTLAKMRPYPTLLDPSREKELLILLGICPLCLTPAILIILSP